MEKRSYETELKIPLDDLLKLLETNLETVNKI